MLLSLTSPYARRVMSVFEGLHKFRQKHNNYPLSSNRLHQKLSEHDYWKVKTFLTVTFPGGAGGWMTAGQPLHDDWDTRGHRGQQGPVFLRWNQNICQICFFISGTHLQIFCWKYFLVVFFQTSQAMTATAVRQAVRWKRTGNGNLPTSGSPTLWTGTPRTRRTTGDRRRSAPRYRWYIYYDAVFVCLSVTKIITSHFRAERHRRKVSHLLGLAGHRPALA